MIATKQDIVDKLNRAWAERTRLHAEGDRLWTEGRKFWGEGVNLWAEGDRLWAEAILATVGNVTVVWGIWNDEHQSWECTLPNQGLHFGF